MLHQVRRLFDVVPDYDLSIMMVNQTLFDVTVNILEKMEDMIQEVKPNVVVLIHGDTSTTFATSLACFYL